MGIHYNKGAELLDFVKNKEDFNMEGGFFKPLMKPGLGVEIDEARVIELSKNAPDWRNPLWRHEDGSSPNGKCASYFALVMRWLHFLTLVTY
jgi:galactonate dehydratase